MAELQSTEKANIGENIEKKEFLFHCYDKCKMMVTVPALRELQVQPVYNHLIEL